MQRMDGKSNEKKNIEKLETEQGQIMTVNRKCKFVQVLESKSNKTSIWNLIRKICYCRSPQKAAI